MTGATCEALPLNNSITCVLGWRDLRWKSTDKDDVPLCTNQLDVACVAAALLVRTLAASSSHSLCKPQITMFLVNW
jgi:hypothetical protein